MCVFKSKGQAERKNNILFNKEIKQFYYSYIHVFLTLNMARVPSRTELRVKWMAIGSSRIILSKMFWSPVEKKSGRHDFVKEGGNKFVQYKKRAITHLSSMGQKYATTGHRSMCLSNSVTYILAGLLKREVLDNKIW